MFSVFDFDCAFVVVMIDVVLEKLSVRRRGGIGESNCLQKILL